MKLTPDHKRPHAVDAEADPRNAEQWQALCGRHQVMKKNYWDNLTGKINAYAVIQAAAEPEKRRVFLFLVEFFGYIMDRKGVIRRRERP